MHHWHQHSSLFTESFTKTTNNAKNAQFQSIVISNFESSKLTRSSKIPNSFLIQLWNLWIKTFQSCHWIFLSMVNWALKTDIISFMRSNGPNWVVVSLFTRYRLPTNGWQPLTTIIWWWDDSCQMLMIISIYYEYNQNERM